jgi:hypothetical protein
LHALHVALDRETCSDGEIVELVEGAWPVGVFAEPFVQSGNLADLYIVSAILWSEGREEALRKTVHTTLKYRITLSAVPNIPPISSAFSMNPILLLHVVCAMKSHAKNEIQSAMSQVLSLFAPSTNRV